MPKLSTPTRGGRWSLPPDERKVNRPISFDPDVLKLLEPYTQKGRRSYIVNQAVREYMKKVADENDNH